MNTIEERILTSDTHDLEKISQTIHLAKPDLTRERFDGLMALVDARFKELDYVKQLGVNAIDSEVKDGDSDYE